MKSGFTLTVRLIGLPHEGIAIASGGSEEEKGELAINDHRQHPVAVGSLYNERPSC